MSDAVFLRFLRERKLTSHCGCYHEDQNEEQKLAVPVTKELNRFLAQVRCRYSSQLWLILPKQRFLRIENSGTHALVVMRIKELIYMFERRAARTEIRRFQLSFYMTLQTECPDSEQN